MPLRVWQHLLKKGIQILRESNLKQFSKISSVSSVGGGPIGGGWAAHFLAKGLKVRSYLHDKNEKKLFLNIVESAWQSLMQIGLKKNASLNNLEITFDLEYALSGTDFVQESIPEVLSIKQQFYNSIDTLLDEKIVVASSTSGLMISDITKKCQTAFRAVVGHPFNPPYLLPLVEIVAGENTKPEVIAWTEGFYRYFDKVPIVLKKEIPGFIATRLQEALWREALHMVKNDEATPEQIDLALINGPAPRMAFQGQCMAFHVACGEGGMATNLDQFGPALELPWTRLKAPELDQVLRDKMVKGCNEMAAGKTFQELVADRDNAIVGILKSLKN